MIKKEIIEKFKSKNLNARVITSLLMGPLFLYFIYRGGLAYIISIFTLTIAGLYEILKMTKRDKPFWKPWFASASIFVLGFFVNMIAIRDYSMNAIYLLIAIVWTTDIAAYFGGIMIGGPKLASAISPGKTVSGAVCALAASTLVGVLFHAFSNKTVFNSWIAAVTGSFLISLISQIGDLLESGLKRYFEVKDSGNLIPGHGGVLDRFDGVIFASFAMMFLINF